MINSLRPRQNGRLFADDTFKCIFLNENIGISTKNSLKFVPKGLINNIPALVLIMAWRQPGDKPLSEPMMVRSLTQICVTQPQWVNSLPPGRCCQFQTYLSACGIVLRSIAQDLLNGKSTLTKVMVWCLITWTNVYQVLWGHEASLDHIELS